MMMYSKHPVCPCVGLCPVALHLSLGFQRGCDVEVVSVATSEKKITWGLTCRWMRCRPVRSEKAVQGLSFTLSVVVCCLHCFSKGLHQCFNSVCLRMVWKDFPMFDTMGS